ncbi:Polyol transporter 5 [Acorus calamus]|uniref:Polyol transporter 5 n=1 Tax=Acorus calamus TaxID=4465 RepID=A0AAV9CH62_ACOCL|nr:Polyol transporter 5 [Acorus calamus]
MSGAAMYIQDDLHVSDNQIEILIGILSVSSLIGSALAGRTSDAIGRRYTIVLSAIIFFIGALVMGFSQNYAVLMVGRFITGIGVGYALMVAPVYTAEVSPASSRGFLTTFPEVFINTGTLLGYISNYAFSHLSKHLSWRLMLGVSAIPSVFLAFGVLAMPESPRWLVMQTTDTPEEAETRLSDIKAAAGIPEDCNDDVVTVSKKCHGEGVWKELLIHPTPSVRKVLICAIGIHFFQQSSGMDAVVFYTPRVFKKAGITNDSKILIATVAVGFTKTLFILVATFLLDRVGRRPLLLSSVGGMIASLIVLGTGLTVVERSAEGTVMWAMAACIAAVLAYVAFFSIGLGPITWVYSSEIFPLRLRAQGASMGVAVNRVKSGVISTTFISLYKAITIGGSFYLFAGFATIAWVFFFTYLPETRGRTLEDMGSLFGKTSHENQNSKEDDQLGQVGQVQLVTANNGRM